MKPRYTFLYARSRDEAYKIFDDYDILWVTCCCNGVRGDCANKKEVNDFFDRYGDLDGSSGGSDPAGDLDHVDADLKSDPAD